MEAHAFGCWACCMPHKHVNRLPSRQVNLQQLVASRHNTTATATTISTLASHCSLIMKRAVAVLLARSLAHSLIDRFIEAICLPIPLYHFLLYLYSRSSRSFLFQLIIISFSFSLPVLRFLFFFVYISSYIYFS